MDRILDSDWFVWGLGLVLGFQLLIVALGEIHYRLERRGRAMAPVFRHLRNLVLPALVVLLFLTRVLDFDAGGIAARLAETALWIGILFTSLTAVNAAVFAGADRTTWRARVPKLFLDLTRAFLVFLGAAFVLSAVWQRDLGGLLAALGVGSIVLGLALQDTLGNLMAGIAMLFERPFTTGDWIKIGDVEGEVIEMNWRSIRIRNRQKDLLVVPNSVLGKELIINTCEPTRLHAEIVEVCFGFEVPPNLAKQMIVATALDVKDVCSDPSPKAETVGYEADRVRYEAKLYTRNLFAVRDIRDDFATRIWYAAQRSGVAMPIPGRLVQPALVPVAAAADARAQRVANGLRRVAVFVSLDRQALEDLARDSAVLHYGRGEVVIRPGDVLPALFVILDGSARVTVPGPDGGETEVAALGPGDFFGESSLLTAEPANAFVSAGSDVEVISIPAQVMRGVLERNANVASDMGQLIEARRRGLRRGGETQASLSAVGGGGTPSAA